MSETSASSVCRGRGGWGGAAANVALKALSCFSFPEEAASLV